MSEKQDEFLFDMATFVSDVLKGTSKFISRLSELEKKYSEEYKNLIDWKDNPLKIIEQLEKIEDDKTKALIATKLFKTFLKLAILSEKLTNVFYVTSDEKEVISKELEELAIDVESCLLESGGA